MSKGSPCCCNHQFHNVLVVNRSSIDSLCQANPIFSHTVITDGDVITVVLPACRDLFRSPQEALVNHSLACSLSPCGVNVGGGG